MSALPKTNRIGVSPAGGSAGAYVTGLDLSKAYGADEVAKLRQALLDHLVVALPDQAISLDDLERLTDALGGRDITPFVTPLADRPFVIRILKEPHEKLNFANAWHTDLSYLPEPPSFTILYCLDAPPVGGDTVWANQHMAFETLSKGLRETLLDLDAVHSAGPAYGTGGYLDGVKDKMSRPIASTRIRRHRASGDRQGRPLSQSGLHAAHCRLDELGISGPASAHLSPCGERELHLAAALGQGHACHLGQPRDAALRTQRLSRLSP